MEDNKKLFVIVGIIGVFATSIAIFLIFQLNLNSDQSPRIETKTVNPDEIVSPSKTSAPINITTRIGSSGDIIRKSNSIIFA